MRVPRTLLGATVAVGLGVAYLALAWHVVFVARMGPTVVNVSESTGRGVHAGDVFALPLGLLGVFCLAVAVAVTQRPARLIPAPVRPRRPRRPPRG